MTEGPTIVPLHSFRETCRKSVIETLEDVLQQAHAGDVVAVSIAAVRPNGAVNTSHSDSDCLPVLVGAAAVAFHRLMEKCE